MTSTEISTVQPPAADVAVRRPGSALLIQDGQERFNEAQVKALEQLGVKDAGQADLDVFFHQSVRTGLDPFLRQIYLIGRNSREEVNGNWVNVKKWTIQTGIDGYRLIAQRSAARNGETISYEEPMWCGPDGKWLPIWLSSNGAPVAAKVTVLRDGLPFPGVVMFEEYVQMTGPRNAPKPNAMWEKMPANQLAKCAEAKALRMAFPHDLSGIYVDSEMPMEVIDEDGNAVAVTGRRKTGSKLRAAIEAQKAQPPVIVAEEPTTVEEGPVPTTPEQRAELTRLFAEANVSESQDKLDVVSAALDREVTDPRSLSGADIAVVIDWLTARAAARDADEGTAAAEPAVSPKIDPAGKMMKRLMVVLGKAEPDETLRHAYLGDVLGFDVEHYTDLTDEQAATAITKMEQPQ